MNFYFNFLDNEKITFNVVSSRSIEEPPSMQVLFANGMKYDLDLKHYRMNKLTPIGCNYIGSLRGDPFSRVSVSGCINNPKDRMQVTVISKNNINKMFNVDSFGNAEIVKAPFSVGGKFT